MYQVFVYGTLRSGGSNAFRMVGTTSLGAATIQAKLYRVHEDFPGVILSANTDDFVVGEVYADVSEEQLLQLDIYEGCDASMPEEERIYQRVKVTAYLESGEPVELYLWEYIREVSEEDRVMGGDWLLELA